MTSKLAINYILLRSDNNTGVPITNIKDTNEKSYRSLLCEICLWLNNDSFSCLKCDKNICKKCVKIKNSEEENSKNVLVCPKCDSNLKEISKFKKNIMDSINIKCINLECNAKILFQNLNSHLQMCGFSKFKCMSLACDYVDYFDKIEEHSKYCKFKIKICSYCDLNLDSDDVEHEKNCRIRLIYCPLCDIRVPKIHFMEHNLENCVNLKIKNAFYEELKVIDEKLEIKDKKINCLKEFLNKKRKKQKKEKINYHSDNPVINIKNGKFTLLNV